jgi:hypothetical protein
MPRWLMMKPSSFPEGTPKTHLFGLSFQRYSRRDAKVSSRSSMRVLEFYGLDDHVIHVGFDVLVELSLEAGLDSSLVGSAGVLQPEGHGRVVVRPNGVMNAVFSWSSSLIAIWWYPE